MRLLSTLFLPILALFLSSAHAAPTSQPTQDQDEPVIITYSVPEYACGHVHRSLSSYYVLKGRNTEVHEQMLKKALKSNSNPFCGFDAWKYREENKNGGNDFEAVFETALACQGRVEATLRQLLRADVKCPTDTWDRVATEFHSPDPFES